MKKLSTPVKVIFVIIIALVVLAAVAYFARGWIRKSVIPSLVASTQGEAMKKQVNDELAKLSDPFAKLGYNTIESKGVHCETGAAHIFRTGLACTYEVNASRQVGNDQMLVQNGTELQQKLQQNGWNGDFVDERDTTSLHEFVTTMSHNSDATPDAYYDKKVGDAFCIFQTVASSSSPEPVAMATHLTCTKQIVLF